jgi:hypothetical protein
MPYFVHKVNTTVNFSFISSKGSPLSILDLFSPKIHSTDPRVRLAALEKITGQGKLAEIAKNDPEGYVRLAAAEKIKDPKVAQPLLEALVEVHQSDTVRFKAARKLHNQHLAQLTFTNLAARAKVCWLRLAAAKKITNRALAQTFFRTMVQNKHFYYKAVRESAEKLLKASKTDQAFLDDSRKKDPARIQIQMCPNHNLAMTMADGDLDFPVDHIHCEKCTNHPMDIKTKKANALLWHWPPPGRAKAKSGNPKT